jgi:transcriptional regulator with XRE-family HTH domain
MSGEVSHEDRERRAKKFRSARKARGWTQKELADLASVDYRSLQAWESGHAAPQVDNLLQVERALGINYEPGAAPDLNLASPDIYAFLVAFYTVLSDMPPQERGILIARAILTLRE